MLPKQLQRLENDVVTNYPVQSRSADSRHSVPNTRQPPGGIWTAARLRIFCQAKIFRRSSHFSPKADHCRDSQMSRQPFDLHAAQRLIYARIRIWQYNSIMKVSLAASLIF